jgi:hypothetical protein
MLKKILPGGETPSLSMGEQKKNASSCAKAGCHGKPHKGSIFCFPHDPGVKKSGGAPAGNLNAASPGSLYSKFLTEEERLQLAKSGEVKGIDDEIQAAQVVVMRLLSEGDNETAIRALALVGRLKAQARREGGDAATGIVEAVTTIMEELGISGGPGDLTPGLN